MRRSVVLLALACAACRVAQPITPPDTSRADAQVEPVPVEDEPAQIEAQPALDPESLVYLPAPGNGLFQLDHQQPSLALIIDVEPDDKARAQLATQLADGDGHTILSAEQEKSLGLERPQSVWMFGSSGPCEAKLGSPYAIADAEGLLVLELGYVVEPCTDEFAPVAHLGSQPAPLSWRRVDCSDAEQIAAPDSWAHPQRAAYEQLGMLDWEPSEDYPTEPEQWWIRSCAVEPAIVELAWSWVWPDKPCWQGEYVSRDIAWWRDGALELLPRLDEGVAPELIGALVNGEEPIAIFASGWPELYIGVRTGDEFGWTAMTVGEFHDEVVAASDDWSVLDCDDDP
jgi:hypothetical protein